VKKKPKCTHKTTEIVALIYLNTKKTQTRALRVLVDTGASASVIIGEHCTKLKIKTTPTTTWSTKAGTFTTNKRARLQFVLPEFHQTKEITWTCHVDDTAVATTSQYDMILGRDLLEALGLIINFYDHTMTWEEATIPMKDYGSLPTLQSADEYCDQIYLTDVENEVTTRMTRILDAKYEKADLAKVAADSEHLTNDEQSKLLAVLRRYESIFDGGLGLWRTTPIRLELKSDATPYHAKPFPIPRSREETTRKEIDRLCRIGVLQKCNDSEWGAPTFIIPKKNGTVRFISDFRELNKRLKRKPFPIPKINDLLLKLEGFQYATSLDLNMGYYHLELDLLAQEMCTIVLPWGKYRYKRLPMGVANSPDIFQEKMSTLMAGLEFVRTYLDDVLVLTTGTWDDHLRKLDVVLHRIAQAGLKVNATKSAFGKTQIEYLGFFITRQGIKPLAKKVEAIHAIAPPTTRKQLRRFIGIINYYRDMWKRRSDLLAPLTALCSSSVKWRWTDVEQKAFDLVKTAISKEVLLSYPDFNAPFDIHTDASKYQLGSVISQRGRPVAFYSRKLNPAQQRYTTTERELLSIVETLKEFRNILLGQQVVVHTDHLNLTHKQFNTDRVMRWRLILEEYGVSLTYVKGTTNIVADALSRLSRLEELNFHTVVSDTDLAEFFLNERADDALIYPLDLITIDKAQRNDKDLLRQLQAKAPNLQPKTFRGGVQVICQDGLIYIPKTLRARVTEWYHLMLCHSGTTRTEETIKQHLTWPGLQNHVRACVQTCDVCQRYKKQKRHYGHLPAKAAEAQPWEILCVDLIGPYQVRRKGKEPLRLQAVTMIDPATGWFEVAEIPNRESITVAEQVDKYWFCRYPRPTKVIYDRGSEFIGPSFQELIKDVYQLKAKPTTVKNPQANSVLERIHQVLANMLRTFELEERDINEEDPWTGILNAVGWAVRSTYHTTLRATPGQLVFGRDMVFNIAHEANWKDIQDRKEKLIKYNNQKENAKRVKHEYHVGDKVLMQRTNSTRKLERPYDGPYEITEVFTNGTVAVQKGIVNERVNIRRVFPYRQAPN
jgi:transposase InsO family protein